MRALATLTDDQLLAERARGRAGDAFGVLAPAFPGGVVKSTRWLDASGADVGPSSR